MGPVLPPPAATPCCFFPIIAEGPIAEGPYTWPKNQSVSFLPKLTNKQLKAATGDKMRLLPWSFHSWMFPVFFELMFFSAGERAFILPFKMHRKRRRGVNLDTALLHQPADCSFDLAPLNSITGVLEYSSSKLHVNCLHFPHIRHHAWLWCKSSSFASAPNIQALIGMPESIANIREDALMTRIQTELSLCDGRQPMENTVTKTFDVKMLDYFLAMWGNCFQHNV